MIGIIAIIQKLYLSILSNDILSYMFYKSEVTRGDIIGFAHYYSPFVSFLVNRWINKLYVSNKLRGALLLVALYLIEKL